MGSLAEEGTVIWCLHCGAERSEGAVECPGCGLVFAKWRSRRARQWTKAAADQWTAREALAGNIRPRRPVRRAVLFSAFLFWVGGLKGSADTLDQRSASYWDQAAAVHGVAKSPSVMRSVSLGFSTAPAEALVEKGVFLQPSATFGLLRGSAPSVRGGRIVAKAESKDLRVFALKSLAGGAWDDLSVETVDFGRIAYGEASRRNGRAQIVVSVDGAKERGYKVAFYWSDYRANNERGQAGNPGWNPEMQPVYEAFQGVHESNLREHAGRAYYLSTMRHECRHVADFGNGFRPETLETRAFLEELMHSPLELESIYGLAKTRLRSSSHSAAARRILEGLRGWEDIKDPDDVFRLDREAVATRARKLFESWYGGYSPPDDACLSSIPWEMVSRDGGYARR